MNGDNSADENLMHPLFLDWFQDQYSVGVPSKMLLQQSRAYFQGMRHVTDDDEMKGQLGMAENALRSLEVMLEQLERYNVRMP